jgi:DNA gyrase subunit A
MNTRDEDHVLQAIGARTLDHILFFTNRGRIYSERAFNLPETSRTGKGMPVVNVINLGPDERVTAIAAVPDFDHADYVITATVAGRIKRVELREFSAVRPSGIIAMPLEAGDELAWARVTTGKQDLILVTEQGRALRFPESEVRPMGRTAAGVRGIRLRSGDRLAALEVVEPGGDLLVVTTNGYGKRTALADYPPHGRFTGGIITLSAGRVAMDGRIVSARVVQPSDEVAFFSAAGITLRLRVKDIPQQGRGTSGVRLVQLKTGDTVAVVARLTEVPIVESTAVMGSADLTAAAAEEPLPSDDDLTVASIDTPLMEEEVA